MRYVYTSLSPLVRTTLLTSIKHYNHLAHELTATRRAEFRAWVHSHTPQEIHAANNARHHLRKLMQGTMKKKHPAHTAKIDDDRQPKGVTNAYARFVKERHATGDYKNIKITEASKLAAEEWKALGAAEKKVRYLCIPSLTCANMTTEIRGRSSRGCDQVQARNGRPCLEVRSGSEGAHLV